MKLIFITFLESPRHLFWNAWTAFSKSSCSFGMPSLPPSSLSTRSSKAARLEELLSKRILSCPLMMTWNLTCSRLYLFMTNLMVSWINRKASSATSEVAFITNTILRSEKNVIVKTICNMLFVFKLYAISEFCQLKFLLGSRFCYFGYWYIFF